MFNSNDQDFPILLEEIYDKDIRVKTAWNDPKSEERNRQTYRYFCMILLNFHKYTQFG